MIEAWKKTNWGIVILLAFSFWTSGVFLMRVLGTYDVWSGGVLLLLLYLLTVPIILFSIVSVRKVVGATHRERDHIVLYTTALVLIAHAVVLTVYPSLYAFDSSSELNAVAWLLWFGGVAIWMNSGVERI